MKMMERCSVEISELSETMKQIKDKAESREFAEDSNGKRSDVEGISRNVFTN